MQIIALFMQFIIINKLSMVYLCYEDKASIGENFIVLSPNNRNSSNANVMNVNGSNNPGNLNNNNVSNTNGLRPVISL